MAKITIPQLPAKLYELLDPFSHEERVRAIQATMILFGEGDVPLAAARTRSHAGDQHANTGEPSGAAGDARASTGGQPTPQDYLDQKQPKNKGETLAVAARYREKYSDSDTHSKADLKQVITDARRNFDDNNFARDMNNAKRQSGFFNTGTGRDAAKLSFYGLNFVDALPDREAAEKLKRPVKKRAKKASKKKAKAKKS